MKNNLSYFMLAAIVALLISCGTGKSSNDGSHEKSETYTLKWKDADFMETGPSYLFEDQAGKEFRFNYLIIPEFDLDKNPYFTIRYDTQLPEFKLKDNIQGKWFRVTVEKQIKDIEGIGEKGEVDVIVSLEPVE